MFNAAFRSLLVLTPQAQVCQRSAKVLGTCSPQLEQHCVVPAGFTLTNVRPPSSALVDRIETNGPQPASWTDFASIELASPFRCRSSTAISPYSCTSTCAVLWWK